MILQKARAKVRECLEEAPLFWSYLRHGRPDCVLQFDGGIGDDLLCTAVVHELQVRQRRRIWFQTFYPDLFRGNPDVTLVVRKNLRGVNRFLASRDLAGTSLGYSRNFGDRQEIPRHHAITTMCAALGLQGRISRRPRLFLTGAEKQAGRLGPRQIVFQSSGLSARYPSRTKEWYPARFQALVDGLRDRHTLVQIGSAGDPPLHGALDLRGRTSLRQSAAILASSDLFVGLAGFLQHLARSVDCRAVIVYGGRELPSQTGYECHANVTEHPVCAPCWLRDSCPHGMICMDAITVNRVSAAIDVQLSRLTEEPPEEVDLLPPHAEI